MWCFSEADSWDVLLKQERACEVWREYKLVPTNSGSAIALLAGQYLIGLCIHLCWSSLCWEKQGRELLLAFCLVQVAPTDSCQFHKGLAVAAVLCHHCWLVFGATTELACWHLHITELHCWYPDNEDWNHPKELLLNRSPSLCSITHFSLSFRQWAKGRMLKYLRTLIKLGFGKSKPTAGSAPMAKQSEPEKRTYISTALAQFHAWFTADFKKHLNHGSRAPNMKNPSHYKNTGIPHGFILSLIPLNQPVVTEKNSCLLSSFTTSFFYLTEGNWPKPRQLQNLDEDASETNITCVKEG